MKKNFKYLILLTAICINYGSYAQSNSRNNGRSNKDKCCDDGIVAPMGGKIAFGRSAKWYESAGDENVRLDFAPSLSTSQGTIKDEKGNVIKTIELSTSGGEYAFNPDFLKEGKYYLEIAEKGKTLRSAFKIVPDFNASSITSNNRNNGRSNKDKCCNDGIVAPMGGKIDFDKNAKWYDWDEQTNQITAIRSPMAAMSGVKSTWEAHIRTGDGTYVKSVKGIAYNDSYGIEDNANLPAGKYYLEIEVGGDYYRTGFTVDPSAAPQDTRTSKAKNINEPMVEHVSSSGKQQPTQDRRLVANLLVELDRKESANNNNNGRSNKDGCCNDGIVAPPNYQALAFGLSTQWYTWTEDTGSTDIPNPIPYLSSINNTWTVYLYTDGGTYLSDKSAYINDDELIISIDQMANGGYYIELEANGIFYRTGFRIGDPSPTQSNTPANY